MAFNQSFPTTIFNLTASFRRKIKSALGIAVLIAASVFLLNCSPYDNAPLPEMKPFKARLESVKELCAAIPKPEQFYPTMEPLAKNDKNWTSVACNFRSERNFEEIMPLFGVWFGANGWRQIADKEYDGKPASPDREIKYNKNLQTVTILFYDRRGHQEYPPRAGNYALVCEEISPPMD